MRNQVFTIQNKTENNNIDKIKILLYHYIN